MCTFVLCIYVTNSLLDQHFCDNLFCNKRLNGQTMLNIVNIFVPNVLNFIELSSLVIESTF